MSVGSLICKSFGGFPYRWFLLKLVLFALSFLMRGGLSMID